MAKNKITIKPQPGPQWDFLATEADICIFGGSAGGGKAQPLSEPVLTPFGFRPMGSIKAGDKVISATGRQTTVVQTFPQGKKAVYRVQFEDGAQTRCTKDHLWFVNGKVMTTSAIIDGLAQGKDYQTPLCGAVQFENRGPAGSLIPYALGTYLADECVEDKAKRIPVRYKYAPPQDRVSLIQGLMDKGGRISEEGRCGLYTSSEKLAKDMQWLVWSIGGMAYIKREDAGGFLVDILTKDDSELFPRMKAVLKDRARGNLNRRILSIKPCGEEECQCIRVDEPDGLYVTKDFVVTHNTHGLLLTPLMYKGVQGFNCTIFRRTFKQVFSPGGLWDTAQSIYGLIPNAQMKKVNTSWEFNDNDGLPISKVTFAHIENYSGVDDWQGSQLCEICCETDTPVLMGDGTYKAVADIKVGDRVQTLNGVCEVTAVGRERLEECVAVECNGGRQIQTVDHKLLTDKGWLSYNDIIREETDTYRCNARRLNGVVLHNPIGSRPCDTDRIQEDSHRALQYSHPYIESLRFEAEECVSYSSCEISPCGIKKVKPFTVCGMNHYITKYGFVNKNCFDELTHFDEPTFFYMMSRNRSTCGVKPFIRATCNPDADSWVAKFIEWWIDQDTGYPIPERSGKIRWFVRRDGIINWADTKEELWERFDLKTEEEKDEPRSVTFIMSSIYDNKELLKVNPQYLASLKSLPEVERERLLKGNWKIKSAAGRYFKRTQVQVLLDLPFDLELYCRAWDIAATADKESGDPDYTAGALLGLRKDKSVVVMDVINKRLPAAEVEKLIYNTAVSDRKKYGLKCKIRIPQDPGAAGKILAQNFIKMLSGFPVKAYPVSGSKEQRATPFAAQWQVGNVYVLAADWNEMFFNQLESFPQGAHDDMVDASSDAFNELAKPTFSLRNML